MRSAVLGTDTWITGRHAVNYVQLHDEAWPSSGGQRMVKTIDTTAPYDDIFAQGRTKLAEGLVFTSAGVPAMLMGDEWLESVDFGADTGNRIDWSKVTTYAPIYRYYQKLLSLRRTLAPLRASGAIYVSHVNESGNVIAFRRLDAGGNPVMVIANFSNTDYTGYRFGVPAAGNWSELLDSQDPQYGGSGPVDAGWLAADPISYDGFVQSLAISLPKMAFIVLAPQSLVDVPRTTAGATLELASPWPNPARGPARLSFTLPASTRGELAIHDLAGRRVRTLESGRLSAGLHTSTWDGTDANGRTTPPGLYFVRLRTEAGERTVRLARLP